MKPPLFYYHDLLPETLVEVVSTPASLDDRTLVERIIAAYGRSVAAMGDLGGPIWSGIAGKSRNVHDALLAGDVAAVTDILRHPHRSNLHYGFEMVFEEYAASVRENPAIGRLQARWAHDNLVRVAETIGAIRTYLPEVDFQDRPWDPESLIAAIERVVGCELRFPNTIPEEYGVRTSRGAICHRAVQALYQAWRLAQLRAFAGGGKTLEIGAGLGRTAWFASLFGFSDYTIVDLPLANVAQSYFLGRALGPDRVVLHGEPDVSGPRVRIENPAWFHAAADRYDIALNNDSMVEIGLEAVEDYWRQLARRAEIFVSMNHEAQSFRVADLPGRLGIAVKSLRSFHPVRQGYIEEIFFLGSRFQG
jgi:hypothetical protein